MLYFPATWYRYHQRHMYSNLLIHGSKNPKSSHFASPIIWATTSIRAREKWSVGWVVSRLLQQLDLYTSLYWSWLKELANDYAELGAVYNGFSLNEEGAVANAIEKIGQAVDSSYTETTQMVTSLEGEFAEPIQEHSQFAHIIKQVLKFRHLKHAQVEMIESSLESKKETLENLQLMEDEARRLEEAISRERTIGSNAVNVDELNESPVGNGHAPANYNPSVRRRPTKAWSGPIKMINAVGHSLQGIIDVDPEATRRNQIGKTRDAMGVVCILIYT